jgi:hypothetical protein
VINCKTCDALLDRSLSLASTLRTATKRLAGLAEDSDATFDAALEELQQLRGQCELFRTRLKDHAALHDSFSPRIAPIKQAGTIAKSKTGYDTIPSQMLEEVASSKQSKLRAK